MKFEPVLGYLLLINLLLFLMMGLDKWKAVHHKWRIPEKILLGLGILGGGIGGWLGLLLFNHKSSKWYFKLIYFLGLLVFFAAFYYSNELNQFFYV
ncbi:DUF1294 domain-containing protein [Isobaculum melis]|uniref:Uncharacterized membrane protein YsdA, DUF1294 family n=1 Tax=Isobaculum melis TaxID=142588 RepID=A0A1H9R491_9LACT|nr:DUF1294 domain-containing protein [Isobaculum melis]SER67528.1 Uncharacterized membrane protein YsdA, DUF1294 family [Isobaculum melis]